MRRAAPSSRSAAPGGPRWRRCAGCSGIASGAVTRWPRRASAAPTLAEDVRPDCPGARPRATASSNCRRCDRPCRPGCEIGRLRVDPGGVDQLHQARRASTWAGCTLTYEIPRGLHRGASTTAAARTSVGPARAAALAGMRERVAVYGGSSAPVPRPAAATGYTSAAGREPPSANRRSPSDPGGGRRRPGAGPRRLRG